MGWGNGCKLSRAIELHHSERLDDLLTHNMRIIQSEEVFSFSLDAVLLARFCWVPSRGNIVDLCTGNGVIPLLLSTRTKANITGVELQSRLAGMAERSVHLNRLDEQISIICQDLNVFSREVAPGSYDLVTVNPPYIPAKVGDIHANEHIAIARHEITCTLDEVLLAASRLVKSRGKVAVVHRASRLAELIAAMKKYRLEPKRMRLIHPRIDAEANMVLLEAIKDGAPELRILPPLIVYEGGQYCDELLRVYYGNSPTLSD